MLDRLITYILIVWWYKTVYQVLSVAWTNRITTRLVAFATRSDTGSHNRLDLIQNLVPPHYVCNGYIFTYSIRSYHHYNLRVRLSLLARLAQYTFVIKRVKTGRLSLDIQVSLNWNTVGRDVNMLKQVISLSGTIYLSVDQWYNTPV